jgi:hypothetical protein
MPFSLLRAHAPVLDPPRASEKPRTQGLCRLLAAPAGNSTFPTLSPRIFLHVPGPLPRLLLGCSYPFLPPRHRPSRNLEPVGATAFAAIAVNPYSNFSTAHFTRLQSFTHVQARGFARHPDCSYRSESLSRFRRRPLGFGGCSIAFALALRPTPIVRPRIPATLWAAVTSTSAPISVRYLPEQRIC